MFGRLDAIVDAAWNWLRQAVIVLWYLARPLGFWARIKRGTADGSITLSAYGILALSVLILDLVMFAASDTASAFFSVPPKERVSAITDQWPFLVHLIVALSVVSTLARLTQWATTAPARAIDRMFAYPNAATILIVATVVVVELRNDSRAIDLLPIVLSVFVAATWNILILVPIGIEYPKAFVALFLGGMAPIFLPLFLMFMRDARQPARPWVEVDLNRTTISQSGILSGILRIRNHAKGTIDILSDTNATLSIRYGRAPLYVPLQQMASITIPKWSTNDPYFLSIEANQDGWFEWKVSDQTVSCSLCVRAGVDLLFTLPLSRLSESAPSEEIGLVDGIAGIRPPARGSKVLVIHCTLVPANRQDAGNDVPLSQAERQLSGFCHYVGASRLE